MKDLTKIIDYGKYDNTAENRFSNSQLNQTDAGKEWYNETKDQVKFTMKNPMTGNSVAGSTFVNTEAYEYTPYINAAKTIELWTGNSTFKDWRLKSTNKLFSISKNIVLIPEQNNLAINSGMELGESDSTKSKADNFISKVTGTLGSAGDALTSLTTLVGAGEQVFASEKQMNAAKAINQWDKMRVFKDIKRITIFDSLKFNFTFGQAGIYSGLEEVVKPIYALIYMLAPKFDSNSPAAWVNPPYPIAEVMALETLKNAIKTVTGISSSLIEDYSVSDISTDASSESDSSNVLTNIQDVVADVGIKIKGITAGANKKNAYSNEYNNLWIKYGNFRFGPMQYENYDISFDMSKLDEFGWPTAGSISIKGIQTARKGTTGAYLSMIENDANINSESY